MFTWKTIYISRCVCICKLTRLAARFKDKLLIPLKNSMSFLLENPHRLCSHFNPRVNVTLRFCVCAATVTISSRWLLVDWLNDTIAIRSFRLHYTYVGSSTPLICNLT